MPIYLGNDRLTSIGGSGGAGETIPGETNQEVNGLNYRVFTEGLETEYRVVLGQANFTDNSQNTDTFNSLVLDQGHETVRGVSLTTSTFSNPATSSLNDVYTTVHSHTSSNGGIFYWLDLNCTHTGSLTSSSSNRTLTSQLTLRITIDGGTPFEIVGYVGTGTHNSGSSSGSSGGVVAASRILFGIPVFNSTRASSYRVGTTSEYGVGTINEISLWAPQFGGYVTDNVSGREVLNVSTNDTLSIGFQSRTVENELMEYPGYYMQQVGLPGFRYNSSLLVEAMPSWTRSAAWNPGRSNDGQVTGFICTEQF